MSTDPEFFKRVDGLTGLTAILDVLRWDGDGLVTVVSQDARSKDVLGVAHADRTSIEKTLETGLMHYYSRSRKKLWLKGEQSGHFQKLVELRVDCDGDALLAKVHQVRGNCHLGFHSCFSYQVTTGGSGRWCVKLVAKKVFDPNKTYRPPNDPREGEGKEDDPT
ncbi:MAG TPA: phosphoribosyl-AMP cyclohydrolase [Planctomycetota bacterium]